MRQTFSVSRAVVATALLIGVVAGSGCSWFRKDSKLYAEAPEMRPLEVPPDLTMPQGQGAVAVPGGSATRSTTGGAGFSTPGTREDVFAKVGQVLPGVEGLTVTSSAQALGVYDVTYAGSNFLVRVSDASNGNAYVSAVDPRGVPATGDGPRKVIEAVRTALLAQ